MVTSKPTVGPSHLLRRIQGLVYRNAALEVHTLARVWETVTRPSYQIRAVMKMLAVACAVDALAMCHVFVQVSLIASRYSITILDRSDTAEG